MFKLFLTIVVLMVTLTAQGAGRFEEAKRMGFAYVSSEQFDRAAARLEEVWEQDKSDPQVGEYLAMAYLNSEDKGPNGPRMEKAAIAIIESLYSAGHRVSFLVQHSHEKLALIQGRELNQYCRGRLSIEGKRVIYTGEKGEKAASHSFDVPVVRDIDLNEDDRRGTFVLKTSNGSYFFAIRNRNRNEARLLVNLVKK